MVSSEQQFSGRTVAGRYRLGSRRGSGIDAAVFEAFDERKQRVVSLQVVHPDISTGTEFAAAFRRTMETAAGLTHPNVAEILDFGSDDWNGRETFFVAVEHLGGGSLRDVLDRGRTLSPSQTLAIGLDALRALEVVHRAGLIHGDVRPSTMVFGADRKVRLIDVGLGQLLARMLWSDVVHVTNERAMYAAPEVAAREAAVPKSDVYSLCLTMLECVTGHVPFVGDSTVATLSNRIGRLLPVSADLGALAAVLERAGRPDPDGRYTVAEFGQALVSTAPRLPRPTPIPVLGAGLFDRDATRPLSRTSEPGAARPAAAGVAAPAAAGPPGIVDPLVAAASATAGAAPDVQPAEVEAGAVGTAHRTAPDAGASRAQGEGEGDGAGVDAADVDAEDAEVAADLASLEAGLAPGEAPPVAAEPSTDALPWATTLPTGDPAALPPPAAVAAAEPLAAPAVPHTVEPPPTEAIPPVVAPPTQAIPRTVAPPPTQAIPRTVEPPPTRLMPAAPVEPTQMVRAVVPSSTNPPAVTLYDEHLPPSRRRHSRLWWFVPVLIVLAAVGGTIAYVANRVVSHRVPALAGLSQGTALNEVAGLGWTTLTPQEASETVAVGQVIRTDPVNGTSLKEGKTLTIVVSTGPAPRPLPELKGMTLDAATSALTALGLKIEQGDAVFDDTVPSGSVVTWLVPDQPNLVAGNTVTPGIVVRVQLSKGPQPTLPELKGLTIDAATAALTAQQLQIQQAAPAYDEVVPAGQVLSWGVPDHPELVAGSRVDPGVVVQVVVSNGPAPRPAPTLAGLAAADAQAAVESIGLVYAQLPDQFSPTVPKGVVLQQDPAPTTPVPKGGTVSVVLSKGPDVVAVPDVTNKALGDAQNSLSAAGLAVGTVIGNADGVVTAFTVAGNQLTPGQSLPRGTPVDLTLT